MKICDFIDSHSSNGIDERLFYDIYNHEPLIWYLDVLCTDGYKSIVEIKPEPGDDSCDINFPFSNKMRELVYKAIPNRCVKSYGIYAVASSSGMQEILDNNNTFPVYVAKWKNDPMAPPRTF